MPALRASELNGRSHQSVLRKKSGGFLENGLRRQAAVGQPAGLSTAARQSAGGQLENRAAAVHTEPVGDCGQSSCPPKLGA